LTIQCSTSKIKLKNRYSGHKDNQGGFQTGQYLWDSGLYLARWVLEQRDRLRGRRAIELGSGLGMPGLVAAKFAAETVLTDCADDIVANLRDAIRLNHNGTHAQQQHNIRDDGDGCGSGGSSGGWDSCGAGAKATAAHMAALPCAGSSTGDVDAAASPAPQSPPLPSRAPQCRAEVLDWTIVLVSAATAAAAGAEPQLHGGTSSNIAYASTSTATNACEGAGEGADAAIESAGSGGGGGGTVGVGTFDVVLASDCVYMVAMAPLVAGVVAALLRPGGFALLVFPEGRPGVPEFLDLMRGCVCVCVPASASRGVHASGRTCVQASFRKQMRASS
jgi:predicted nicotinamide N-methyase